MAQTQKDHVRAAIVRGAAELFAEVGYEAATIASVAERAGSSVGNVYKYFGSKEALLEVVLPPSFAEELRRMVHRRMRALGEARLVDDLPPDAEYHLVAAELVDHCLAHRERVVLLLARGEGTPYARFSADLARSMTSWALEYVATVWPSGKVDRVLRATLERIYASYVVGLGDVLAAHRDARHARAAIDHLSQYHLGGLRRLFETASTSPPARGARA